MLGAHTGIVEAGADGVGVQDLAFPVLQDIGFTAMQDARPSGFDAGGMLAGGETVPRRLDADQLYRGVVQERIEDSRRIAPAANAGDDHLRQAVFQFKELLTGLDADHALEIAHHDWVRMGSCDGSDDIERGINCRNPGA